MSRISKAECEVIAKEMTSKLTEELKSIKSKINKIFEDHFRSQIPGEVMILFEKYPHLFSTRKYFNLNNSNLRIEISEELPFSKNQSGWISELDLSIRDKIIKLWKTYQIKERERTELSNKIENALYELRTYKRISELFPEAAPFIKIKDGIMLPTIPLQQIRKDLAKINDTVV